MVYTQWLSNGEYRTSIMFEMSIIQWLCAKEEKTKLEVSNRHCTQFQYTRTVHTTNTHFVRRQDGRTIHTYDVYYTHYYSCKVMNSSINPSIGTLFTLNIVVVKNFVFSLSLGSMWSKCTCNTHTHRQRENFSYGDLFNGNIPLELRLKTPVKRANVK